MKVSMTVKPSNMKTFLVAEMEAFYVFFFHLWDITLILINWFMFTVENLNKVEMFYGLFKSYFH